MAVLRTRLSSLGVSNRVGAVLGVVFLLSLVAAPALAQDEPLEDDIEQYLTDDEIGAGSCSPDALSGSTLTECRFPLSGEGWESFNGPFGHVAIVEDFEFTTSAPCVVEGDDLVCRDLVAPSWRDTFRVDLRGYFLEDRRPTITVDREFDSVIGIIQTVDRLKTVFAGGTLTLEVFRAGSLDDDAPVEVHLRRPGSDVVEARATALAPGEQDGSFSLSIPDVGRWEFVSCALDADNACFRTGIPTALNALSTDTVEVVDGHNNVDDDRINIVFVGTGYESSEALRAHAEALLAVDGQPVSVDFSGVRTDTPDDLAWGPFAIDPLRGQIDKFNFWYLDSINTGSPLTVRHDAFSSTEVDVSALGLGPHVVIVNATLWRETDGFRAMAELPNFSTPGSTFEPQPAALEPALASDYNDVRFGSVFLPVTSADSLTDAVVLAHEFGHALFGLRDEYVEWGQELPTIGRPNCAIDRADAEGLWAELVGELDPMYEEWAEASAEAGVELFFERENFVVDYVQGGCFGETETAVRPTENSLMNANVPVLGAVNRKRAQDVLDLWPEPTPVTTTTTSPPTTQAPASTTTEPAAAEEEALEPTASDESGGNAWLLAGIGGLAIAVLGAALLGRRRQQA